MSQERKHKGWHSRGYIPHLDAAEIQQAITFRLADALPSKVIDSWKRELEREVQQKSDHNEQELRERIARYEDAGTDPAYCASHLARRLCRTRCSILMENATGYWSGA